MAVVTGGASGIGAAIAYSLSKAGALVYVADLDTQIGQITVDGICSSGGSAIFGKVDVTNGATIADLVAAIESDQGGQVDILVNNAGIGHVGALLQTSDADLDRLFSVNVRGMFTVTRAFLPGVAAQKNRIDYQSRLSSYE